VEYPKGGIYCIGADSTVIVHRKDNKTRERAFLLNATAPMVGAALRMRMNSKATGTHASVPFHIISLLLAKREQESESPPTNAPETR